MRQRTERRFLLYDKTLGTIREMLILSIADLCASEHTRSAQACIMLEMKFRCLPIMLFLAAFLPSLAWLAPANAQAGGATASAKRAQAERNAVDLKQGMTMDEVRQLLGKPRRTALASNGIGSSTSGQGTLQWTYVWNSAGLSSSSERTLSVEFAAKTADQWLVNSWSWNNSY